MAETMLVTQALSELKTLDGRISRAIVEASFVNGAKTSDKNVVPGVTKEDFCESAKASEKSINALIERREKIKAAIVHSNAITPVENLGMTVAQAIETKASIKYKKALLKTYVDQYSKSQAIVSRQNVVVDDQINAMLSSMYGAGGNGKDKKSYTKEDFDAIAIPYREHNGWELVDPIGIKAKIDALRKEIEDFESSVDSELQISNCTTTITID